MSALPKGITLDQVEIWFQDETRIGQQGSLSRLWAPKGTRPRAVRQQQFLYQYIYGAVCPEEKKGAAIIADCADSEVMSAHLEEIAHHISEGKHGILVMDRAGWHRSAQLRCPSNITILHLPAYSPELNPQEDVWRVLKDRFLKNRVYDSLEEITEAACHAWNTWIENKDEIASTCQRKWAKLY